MSLKYSLYVGGYYRVEMIDFVNRDLVIDVSSEELLKERKTKSLKRRWNELAKCQKNLIITTVFLLSIYVIYIVNVRNNDPKVSMDNEALKNEAEKSINKLQKEENEVGEQPISVYSVANELKSQKNLINKFKSAIKTDRQKAVVKAFQHSWKGYKQFAWGHDHLKPISESYHDWFGLGLTIVDSLDTILIMGLEKEFNEARDWVKRRLHFDVNRDVNLFEVTIRVLGGLLSTYHLTEDELFLNKAIDLANRMLPCFDTESGIPFSDINLFTRKAHAPKWSPDSSTSEVTTIQLEFRDLSRITGDPKYEAAVSKVSEHIHNLEKTDGLVPIFINANSGQFRSYATITLGARGDSYYEYLLKQWLQTGKAVDYLRDDYVSSIEGIEKHLVRRTVPNGFLFIGELLAGGKDFKPKMDHLTCYLSGTLALGVHNGLPSSHMKLAEDLLTTCYQTYAQHPTFLAPEITYFNILGENSNDMYVKANDAHNLLRPEFIESLWYMYQITGNTTYQDWGWQIFQGFENYTKVANGYTSIGNVKSVTNLRPKDMMESFFLSETLKYLYLLFSDNPKLLNIDDFVINSEAHPLPIFKV